MWREHSWRMTAFACHTFWRANHQLGSDIFWSQSSKCPRSTGPLSQRVSWQCMIDPDPCISWSSKSKASQEVPGKSEPRTPWSSSPIRTSMTWASSSLDLNTHNQSRVLSLGIVAMVEWFHSFSSLEVSLHLRHWSITGLSNQTCLSIWDMTP